VVTEFVQMVLAQRAYESNSKVIKAADDMYSQVDSNSVSERLSLTH
jgi:flagellar basal-body rod protein FlgG